MFISMYFQFRLIVFVFWLHFGIVGHFSSLAPLLSTVVAILSLLAMSTISVIHFVWFTMIWECPLNASPATFILYSTTSFLLLRVFTAMFSSFMELTGLVLSSSAAAMKTCHSDLLKCRV